MACGYYIYVKISVIHSDYLNLMSFIPFAPFSLLTAATTRVDMPCLKDYQVIFSRV